jgi:NDP-sugar pyrophosphorylase family protein
MTSRRRDRDIAAATVVLPAGGRGERLGELAESHKINKAVIRAGRLTLIERAIRLYTRAGVRRFVVLVFHRADSIRRVLGDGRRLGISVKYSRDPARPVGKGGAVLLAIRRGLIPASAPFIVHNPDDQIVGIEKGYASRLWARHRTAARRGALATAVCVPWTEYAFTAFTVRGGMAARARMYPKVEFPTHIGVTVFEPGAIAVFRKLIDPSKRQDFESVVLPHLARVGRLAVAMIHPKSWIPVNDLKAYRKLNSIFRGK